MELCSLLTCDEDFEKLKCGICNNYLSHFPIHSTTSGDNVCGRCPISSNDFKNEIYEIVSTCMKFPCRYTSEGCWKTLIPENIPQHEEQCPYKTSGCPTREITACVMQVSQPNLIKHCYEEHSEYLIQDAEFEIDIKISRRYSYLVEFENEILILRCVFKPKEKLFRLTLPRKGNFKLKLTCGSKSLSVKCDDTKHEEKFYKINLDWLISPDESKLTAKFYLEKRTTSTLRENLNNKLVNLWKCSSCSKYVFGLYLKQDFPLCPRCKGSFSSDMSQLTKLFVLANFVAFPCENTTEGCNFTGSREEIKKHRKICQFGVQECPLKDLKCSWSGLRNSLEEHLEDHNLGPEFTGSSELNQVFSDITKHVLKLSHYLFDLFFVFNGKLKILGWIVQKNAQFKDMFRYEVHIFSDSNSVTKISLGQTCLERTTRRGLFDNLEKNCYVTVDQIKTHFNVGNEIKYKIRIFGE